MVYSVDLVFMLPSGGGIRLATVCHVIVSAVQTGCLRSEKLDGRDFLPIL